MSVTLPDLPYAQDALEPHISANTLSFHYGKHHQAYVDNLNKMIAGTPHDGASLEAIVTESAINSDMQGVFNNAAQIWNHTFYWHSMSANGGGKPTGKIAELIDRDFGSYDEFKSAFAAAGATQFGSGWAWLVLKGEKLEVRKTANADTPLTEIGVTPLLTMDVWEHAYYLDFQNKRPAYIETFLDKLVNWDFANQNLAAA
ncbi:superoxide dismutase [Parvularcula sp. IMCC14364]|uniref:superoxide dismutase n=1 Tax=Parvularcula sp. IMCC14364 TaxID=3067902 RepID=UPI002741E887|nr:superoxide dismutase [Parvularcula sp. IMCC14364]